MKGNNLMGTKNTINIKNRYLDVSIDTLGAELSSIKDSNGTERLWQGSPDFWISRAPVLFPITGGLKDDKYIVYGKEYTMPKHGYAKVCEFVPEKVSDVMAVFTLYSDNESRKYFPFEYELKITYKLTGKRMDVVYEVLNKSARDMYFSIGSHEGYSCPEGIGEYIFVFPRKMTLSTTVLAGNLLSTGKQLIIKDSNVLPLDYKYFAVDALVFEGIDTDSVVLKHLKSDKEIKVDFKGFKNLMIWTKPSALYICIEPWCGKPDMADSKYDFVSKPDIEKLAPESVFTRTHSITVEG